jgi:hypothetical protein
MNRPGHQRFRLACRTVRFAVTAVLAMPWAACGGGGGSGGGTTRPELLSASFGGNIGAPQQGDTLLLFFSADMASATGLAVTAETVVISGGGSLGTGAAISSQPTARQMRITLGDSPVLLPGVSTIDMAPAQSVFRDLVGNTAQPATPRIVLVGDGQPPSVDFVTIAAVDAELNGTGPAGGVLQTPRTGWTLDITWSDAGLGVAPGATRIQSSTTVSTAAGPKPPGTNLLPFLTPLSSSANGTRYALPTSTVFPASPTTLEVVAVDLGGQASDVRSYSFTVRNFTDSLQPFETAVNAQQVWWIDTTRDIESLSSRAIPGGGAIDAQAGSNGTPDLVDVLYELGLQSATPIPGVSGGDDSNTVVYDRFRQTILTELAAYFSGTNIIFTYTQPAGGFGSNPAVPYANLGYSQICLAGSSEIPGVLGIAQLDPNNGFQNNDCLLESGSQNRLGVFLHTIADAGVGPPSNSTFRFQFNSFAPILGGLPIGDEAFDDQRLQGSLTDTRALRMDAAIADLARFAAVVLAHECGHSMGLVVNGAMPIGLYGNDAVNFPGSTDGHIRTQSLFPNGSTNVMSPALSYSLAIDPNTAFNSLNLAYLQEQVFYGN